MAVVERGAIVLYYNVVQRPNVGMGLLIPTRSHRHGSRLDITSTLSYGTTVVFFVADENSA